MKSQQSSDSATRSLSFSTTILISKSLTRAICRLQTLLSATERKVVGKAGSPLRAVHISRHGAHGVTRPSADFFCLSASHPKPLGKKPRQTSLRHFLLRGGEIVFYSQQFDEVVLDVVNTISGAPVSVTRLSHAAGVDEVFFARLNSNVFGGLTPDAVIAHKYHRHMRVAEKTDGRPLIRKTGDGVEIIKYVAPLPGRIQGSVHDRKIVYPSLQRQATQPFLVLLIQTFARPLDGAFGKLVKTFR